MITRKGRFLIKHEEIDSDYVANFDFEKLEKEYQRLKGLYEFEKDIDIRICFLYNPDEYLFFLNREYKEEWLWARAINGKMICIFSPSVCEKYTSHKKEGIFRTLVHEICHLIYHNSNLGKSVFNEGLAYYFSGMSRTSPNKKDLSLRLSSDYSTDSNNGFFLSKLIIENIKDGRQKILQFLKLSRYEKSDEEINIFNKVFNMKFEDLIKLKGGDIK